MNGELYIFEQRHADRISELAAVGVSRRDIAIEIGLPLCELNQLYRDQLRRAAVQGREQVLKKLHEVATEGNNAGVLTFYAKSQCGWRDTGSAAAVTKIVHRSFSVGLDAGPQKDAIPDKPPSE